MSSRLSSYMRRQLMPTLTEFPEFIGSFKRARSGRSKFVWTATELEIVCLGFRQFSSLYSHYRLSNHILDLIRSSVKSTVISQAMKACEFAAHTHTDPSTHLNFASFSPKLHAWFETQFHRIAARWIRFPSFAAVSFKLKQCYTLASRDLDTRVYSVTQLHQQTWQMIHHRVNYHHAPCHLFDLPCLPADLLLHKFGFCFQCGVGIDDKSEVNFATRCDCDSAQSDDNHIILCDSCATPPCCDNCCDICCQCTCQYCYQGIHHNY